MVQLRAPEHARGRVLSLFMLSLGTVYPVGAVAQGAVAGAAGVRAVTAGAAALLAVVLVAVALLRRGRAFAALGAG
ncbi:MAG: hypothetical protein ACRDZR_04250 [Acidimicrobiales bacterium]